MTDNMKQLEVKAAVFDRLLAHLDKRKDVQNIDLMILAGFCRNCLYKWYHAEAGEHGLDIDISEAQEQIYGMDYGEWKSLYQRPATEEQKQAYSNIKPEDMS